MHYKNPELHKEKSNKYSTEWMRKSRAKDPAKHIENNRRFRENNPRNRLIYSTKQSARLKNLDHNITIEDLTTPEYCPLLNIKIDYTAGTGKTMLKPSVDRIDPTKGYVKGNVEVISSLANTMKCKATPEQLVFFAKELLKRYAPSL